MATSSVKGTGKPRKAPGPRKTFVLYRIGKDANGEADIVDLRLTRKADESMINFIGDGGKCKIVTEAKANAA